MAIGNGRVPEAVGPPFVELFVDNHKELFVGTVGFSIRIADVNSNGNVVESSVDRP